GLGDDIAVRMAAGLLMGDRAVGDQLLHVAVVLRELGELAVAPQVNPAVSNPGHFETVALDPCGNHGGAHRQGIVAAARGTDDFLVGDPDRLRERGAVADLADDGLASERAGHLAVLVPAHAVGHQPQSQLAVAVIAVFVELATQADVGQVSEFDHGSVMPVALSGSSDGITESSWRGGREARRSVSDSRSRKRAASSPFPGTLAERGGFEPPVRY